MRLQQPNRELAVRNELADLLTKLGDLEKSLPPSDRVHSRYLEHTRGSQKAEVKAARRLNRCLSGILALSVLADSAVEHYRGSFENKAMYTPLIIAAMTLAVSAHGPMDRRPGADMLRDVVYALGATTGLVGTGFHLYNVLKRPGRLTWQNLFYGAPIGAPAAILLSGLFGVYSERLRGSNGPTQGCSDYRPVGHWPHSQVPLLGTRGGRIAAFPRRLS